MSINPQIQQQLESALQFFNDSNEEIRNRALQFLDEFRLQEPLQYIVGLIAYLSNPEAPSRPLAAVMIHGVLHKRTPDAQRHFVPSWYKVDIGIREQLLMSSTQALLNGDSSLKFQCSNLLGLFYAIEFYTQCSREAIHPLFNTAFIELLESGMNSPDPDVRLLLYTVFSNFAQNSLELNPNCSRDHVFLNIAPQIFNIFLGGMVIDNFIVQKKAIESFTASFLIFKRQFSFASPRSQLLEVLFKIITANIPPLLTPAYQLLRKCIDCCYPDMQEHMKQIEFITFNDLKNGNDPDRQIEACFLWSTIGDVESDIQNPNKHLVKIKHRDFTTNEIYSKWAFSTLFELLVLLICSTDPDEIKAHIALDMTPAHAAFTCISSLTKATDRDALPIIFEFVKNQSQSGDWRNRYASALLLNAASQVPSFNDVKNILIAFDFFVNSIVDPIPRISEVAMWSLGRMVVEIPELVTDPQRFGRLCQNVASRMDDSEELTSRACWLLNTCFNVFSVDDTDSPLVHNFAMFAQLLMNAAEKYDVNAQDAAFGALNRLIEKTPSTIADEYNNLFGMVTAKLSVLINISDPAMRSSPKYVQQVIGLLSLVQAIVMNVGPMISNVSDALMMMLIAALDFQNESFVCEVLPAMGAVARAIKEDFARYLPHLLEKVFLYLKKAEFVQPAAVFVADIFNSFETFPEDITQQFVSALFNTLNFDDATTQARIASFSALAEIAKMIGDKCVPWIETYLDQLEAESRSMLSNDDESNDPDNARSFAVENLTIYQTLVPILAKIPKGDRKVRNFFHIFEKIVKLDCLDESVLPDAVILIGVIANTYQRKMNVYLNKPAVLEILKQAIQSQDPALATHAQKTFDMVRMF